MAMSCHDIGWALAQGLTIKKTLKAVPDFDVSGGARPISQLLRGTTIDSGHIRALCKAGKLKAVKVKGRWLVYVWSFSRWLDRYRHRHCRTRRGKKWGPEELAALSAGLPVDRTEIACRVMKCRMRKR